MELREAMISQAIGALESLQGLDGFDIERLAEAQAGWLLNACAESVTISSLELVTELYQRSGERWERAHQVGEQIAEQLRFLMEARYGTAR